MFNSGALKVLLAVFVLLESSAQLGSARKIVYEEIYSGPLCSSPKVGLAPFALANKCNQFLREVSFNFNCETSQFQLFFTPNCTATDPIFPNDAICSAGTLGTEERASGYTCGDIDNSKLIVMKVSNAGACGSVNSFDPLSAVTFSFVQVIDSCVPVPTRVSGVSSKPFYRVTVGDAKTVTYTAFDDSACTAGADVQYTGKLDECRASVIDPNRRRLAAFNGAVVFESVGNGANSHNCASIVGILLMLCLSAFVL